MLVFVRVESEESEEDVKMVPVKRGKAPRGRAPTKAKAPARGKAKKSDPTKARQSVAIDDDRDHFTTVTTPVAVRILAMCITDLPELVNSHISLSLCTD